MKMYTKILCMVIVFGMLFCACNSVDGSNNMNNIVKKPVVEYTKPSDLLTEQEYIDSIEKLCATENFTVADDGYLKKVDKLGDNLKNMIIYNEDELDVAGKKYYVSNDGNDQNDGLTPETAWATLTKVALAELKKGDAVLFNRGDFFRGQLLPKDEVTYSAYGKGFKPIIANSIDGLTYAKWVETDTPNVWKLDSKIYDNDIGLIVFNMGEAYAEKKMEMAKLKENFDFCHNNKNVDGKIDNFVYMYCDKGNPVDLFWSIELSNASSTAKMKSEQHDIKLHNLSLYFGQDFFFASGLTNISMEYCELAWMGGHYVGNTRLGGGGGAWFSCENITFEHCYFHQHFDAGVTPQYNYNDEKPAVFSKFITKACLFEYCEYTYEYFLNHPNSKGGDKFSENYFGYNFCRYGGQGFGDKATASAYVKSWSSPNPSENCKIEKNIFDRPFRNALQMSAKNDKGEFDITKMPEMNNNVYIAQKDRYVININEKKYKFNEETHKLLSDLGFEKDAVYVYVSK